jgi:mevalonate kinase
LTLQKLNVSAIPDLTLVIRSTIPMGAGYGSGAAISAAIIRALSQALGTPLSKEDLNTLVYEVEKLHHGTPSGIDNTVIVYEQPLIFIKGQPIQVFAVQHPFQLIVADTGHRTPTHVPVGDVRTLYQAQPEYYGNIFQNIGNIVHSARTAMNMGDFVTLGQLMNQNHTFLRELTVSDDKLDALCTVARNAGALGAKLSGGGRGGNIMALVTDETRETVQQALLGQGAVKATLTTVQ